MPIARTGYVPQEQAPSTRIPISARRQGRREWFRLLGAERRCACLQRLNGLWKVPHEQVRIQKADSYRDFIIQVQKPALRLAIYQHVAMS